MRWFSWDEAIAMRDAGLEGALRALQPGEPVLRRASAADAAAIAHVFLRSRLHATPEIPNLHAEDDVTGWIGGRIAADEVWVADLDGVVVAEMILAASPGARGPMHLDHLYLDPAWMGRGLGDQLLRLADERGSRLARAVDPPGQRRRAPLLRAPRLHRRRADRRRDERGTAPRRPLRPHPLTRLRVDAQSE